MLTAKQDNRLTAAETLVAALTSDPTPYAADKAFQAVVARLQQLIAAMLPYRQQVQRSATSTPSQPSRKEQARQHLALVTAEVAGDVFGYATDQQNPALQALADYNEPTLAKLRGTRLTDVATALYNATQDKAYKQALRDDYDLTAARAQELQEALTAFNTLKTQPREAVVAGRTARASLRTEFAELATLLQDRLLRQLRKYRRRDPDFYARIVAAREVIDRPGSRPAPADAQPGA